MTDAFDILTGGLQFPEGPIALDDGSVILVEIKSGDITCVNADGTKRRLAKLGGGPNGAAFGPDGKLYICNNGGFSWRVDDRGMTFPSGQADDYSGGRIERLDVETGELELLYDSCNGVALRGPNDICFDAHGGFYFTDHGKRRQRDMDLGGLYYATTDGNRIAELVHPMEMPNGVGLSPDEQTVYVAETNTGRLWAFDILEPGTVDRPLPHGGRLMLGPHAFTSYDSLAVEENGNICIASLVVGGINVIAPDGGFVEFVPLPDPACTNICFGGPDMMTAYVTLSATGKLISLPWPRAGLKLNGRATTPGL